MTNPDAATLAAEEIAILMSCMDAYEDTSRYGEQIASIIRKHFATVPSPALPGEREAFEAWMDGTGFLLKRHDDGDYMSIHTERMWRAWQASAAAPTVATPEEERENGATDTPPRTCYSAILDKTWTLEKVRIETEDLKFAVQYTSKDGSYGRWLTMCAYDVDSIAVKYAHDCNADNRPWTYRAVEIDPSSWQASRTPAVDAGSSLTEEERTQIASARRWIGLKSPQPEMGIADDKIRDLLAIIDKHCARAAIAAMQGE